MKLEIVPELAEWIKREIDGFIHTVYVYCIYDVYGIRPVCISYVSSAYPTAVCVNWVPLQVSRYSALCKSAFHLAHSFGLQQWAS